MSEVCESRIKLSFIIRTKPISINHAYGQFRNRRYLTKAGKDYKEVVKHVLFESRQLAGLLTEPPSENKIQVSMHYYFPDYRSRDIDNYSKFLIDSMQGVLFKNDNQIVKLTLEKSVDTGLPRTEVTVWEKLERVPDSASGDSEVSDQIVHLPRHKLKKTRRKK